MRSTRWQRFRCWWGYHRFVSHAHRVRGVHATVWYRWGHCEWCGKELLEKEAE